MSEERKEHDRRTMSPIDFNRKYYSAVVDKLYYRLREQPKDLLNQEIQGAHNG